jgi:hypothetical protein
LGEQQVPIQVPDAESVAALPVQVEEHVVLGERNFIMGELGEQLTKYRDLCTVEGFPGIDGWRSLIHSHSLGEPEEDATKVQQSRVASKLRSAD